MSEIEPGPEENQKSEPAVVETQNPVPSVDESSAAERDRETKQWAMFIHFSILAGWVIPLGGLIVPILLWQIKKDELPGIVPHAYVVFNWIITSLVYAVICLILTIVLIGILGFIALAIVTIIFAVMGGIKANAGEVWEYPGTFIKVFK